jgi:hypothetical protein
MKLLLVNFLVWCDDFVAKSIDDYILDDDQWNKNHGQCFFYVSYSINNCISNYTKL